MHPRNEKPPTRSLPWAIFPVVAIMLVSTGCVERRLFIRSNPPGAVVYVGNKQVGVTPVGVNFTYYGSRDITLVKDGFQTVKDRVEIPPPWYQYFPADFVAENVVPARIRDYRTLDYQLTPKFVVPTEEILDRAEQLRQAGQTGAPVVPEPTQPELNTYLPPQ